MSAAQPDDEQAKGRFSTKPLPGVKPHVLRGEELFQYVVDRLGSGAGKRDVYEELVAMGYPAADAEPWVEKVVAWRRKHCEDHALPQYPQAPGHPEASVSNRGSNIGRGHMGIGGIAFLLGVGLTIVSHQAAQKSNTPYYLIFYGAIVWGAVQFLLGWWNRNR